MTFTTVTTVIQKTDKMPTERLKVIGKLHDMQGHTLS